MPESAIERCTAIVAALCIQGSSTIESVSSTTWSGATVRIADVSIVSAIGSDAITEPYLPMMRKTCRGSKCVYYRGNCAWHTERSACTLWYTFGADMPLRNVMLKGPRASLEAVLPTIDLVRSAAFTIPLSRFALIADDDSAPTCRRREGCSSKGREPW
jgi:hypothetical protein